MSNVNYTLPTFYRNNFTIVPKYYYQSSSFYSLTPNFNIPEGKIYLKGGYGSFYYTFSWTFSNEFKTESGTASFSVYVREINYTKEWFVNRYFISPIFPTRDLFKVYDIRPSTTSYEMQGMLNRTINEEGEYIISAIMDRIRAKVNEALENQQRMNYTYCWNPQNKKFCFYFNNARLNSNFTGGFLTEYFDWKILPNMGENYTKNISESEILPGIFGKRIWIVTNNLVENLIYTGQKKGYFDSIIDSYYWSHSIFQYTIGDISYFIPDVLRYYAPTQSVEINCVSIRPTLTYKVFFDNFQLIFA